MVSNDEDLTGDAHAQAAQWIARLRTLPVSRTTLEEFFRWRKVDSNDQAFTDAERFWDSVGELQDDPEIVAIRRSASGRRRTRAGWGAISNAGYALATLCLCILISGAIAFQQLRPGPSYQTAIGAQRVIELADGSKVRLDTDSRIIVHFDGQSRQVILKRGQAFFAVAHDRSHPFIVTADGAAVTATGTRFGVRNVGSAVAVTLVEGGVKVALGKTAPTYLAAGQQWSEVGGGVPVVRSVDATQAVAWTRGTIILDGMPLGDAVAEVNRYAAHPVRLDAGEYASKRIGGSVDTGDVSSFVQAVTALLPLQSERLPDGSVRLFSPNQADIKKNL